jgi:hypothetical protein
MHVYQDQGGSTKLLVLNQEENVLFMHLSGSFVRVSLPVISDVQQLMWRIEDSVVQLKRLIADVVVTWNGKIQDLVLISKRRDEKHRKSEGGKPSAPTTSHSLECDVVSLKDIYFFLFICSLFNSVCNLHYIG